MQIKSFTGTRTLEAKPVQSDSGAIHVRFTNNNNYHQPDYGNFSRKDFVALIKDAGITAEDLREPDNAERVHAMGVGTQFDYEDPFGATSKYVKVSATSVARITTGDYSALADIDTHFESTRGTIKIKE